MRIEIIGKFKMHVYKQILLIQGIGNKVQIVSVYKVYNSIFKKGSLRVDSRRCF